MSDLQNLYQQVILDHARERHGYGLAGDEAATSHQFNPTCGDEVTVGVRTEDDGRIAAIGWEGHGCSISTASASLLSDLVEHVDRERLAASIAAELHLSVDAVKAHLRSLFQRFGIEALPQNQKRSTLVAEAFQRGVITQRDL